MCDYIHIHLSKFGLHSQRPSWAEVSWAPSCAESPSANRWRTGHGLVAVVRKIHGKWETYGKKTQKIQRNQLELEAFSWEKDETWWENNLSKEVFSWENMGTPVFNGILMGVNGT